MKVEVYVDLEPVSGGQRVVWWATAPALGNLAVAANSLRDLEVLARDAAEAVLEERGDQSGADIRFTLRDDVLATAGPDQDAARFTPHVGSSDPTIHVQAVETGSVSTMGLDGRRAARELTPA